MYERSKAVDEFYQNLDAHGHGIQSGDRRYRKDVLAQGVLAAIDALCDKYCQEITGLSAERIADERPRFCDFLRSLIIVNGSVKSTRYKPGGVRQGKALSIHAIEQEFGERGISFVAFPATLLLDRIKMTSIWIRNYGRYWRRCL